VFGLWKKEKDVNTTQVIDVIEAAVLAHVKPYGFRRHGRTLHRFVSEDISQIIHFQSGVGGLSGLFCVNLGIRVPECADRVFHPQAEGKPYYHEYECTIRSRLGAARGKKETWYDLRKKPDRLIKAILEELDRYVLPVFEVMNSREAILAHRKDYPFFYAYGSEMLDECMILGHLGDMEKAKECFDTYYQSAVAEYDKRARKGYKQYLKKGQRVVYMGQDIVAEKNGFVTLYGANRQHLDYLDALAIQLGFR